MELKLEDFLYDLPKDRIAKEPLKERSSAKLLKFEGRKITDLTFNDLSKALPDNAFLFFNDTRVIPARMHFTKATGALIEIFLLEPISPSSHEEVMNVVSNATWKCMIGNAKKWKIGTSLTHTTGITANRTNQDEVTFTWNDDETFSQKLLAIGKVPLPPYIEREVVEEDKERYQTVFSKLEGAVAAPTAGLHFTKHLMADLQKHQVGMDYLTLHVSAGTFQPITTKNITEHPMHRESIWISKSNIENLLSNKTVIPVGTTAMRTLESLYWYGVKLANGEEDFFITQKDPFQYKAIPVNDSLQIVLEQLEKLNAVKIAGQTEIYIYPGYDLKICKGLITNFHLPGSTLMLLIAALVGDDWKNIYTHALQSNYRFLSYGDGSLLLP